MSSVTPLRKVNTNRAPMNQPPRLRTTGYKERSRALAMGAYGPRWWTRLAIHASDVLVSSPRPAASAMVPLPLAYFAYGILTLSSTPSWSTGSGAGQEPNPVCRLQLIAVETAARKRKLRGNTGDDARTFVTCHWGQAPHRLSSWPSLGSQRPGRG